MRKHLSPVLKLGLAAGLVWWLLHSGRLELRELARVGERWHWLLFAQLPLAALLGLQALRWNILLRVQGICVRLRDTLALTLTGWFFNQMILGTTGGDVVKAYAIAVEQPQRRGAAITSIAMDRLIGLCSLLGCVLVLALPNAALVSRDPRLALYLVSVASVAVALALGVAALLSERARARLPAALLARLPFQGLQGLSGLQGALRSVAEAVYTYRRHPRELALAGVLSLGVHCMTLSVNLLLTRALVDGPIEWLPLAMLILMAHLAMGLPINPPGALGTAEALYQLLFGIAGIGQGGLICVLQRLTWYAWALPGGVLYVARRTRRRDAPGELSAQPPV